MYTKVKYIYFRNKNFGNDENMLGIFTFHILEIPRYHSTIHLKSDSTGPRDTPY